MCSRSTSSTSAISSSQAKPGSVRQAHPDAVCVSALTGEGRTALIETIAQKLEMDTQRVTLEFDAHNADDREKIARVYRHARVVSHTTDNGRVAIEADVPRRVLDRVRAAGTR